MAQMCSIRITVCQKWKIGKREKGCKSLNENDEYTVCPNIELNFRIGNSLSKNSLVSPN